MNNEDSVPHLIELDEALNNERTVFIMPPEPPPNSTTSHSYNGVLFFRKPIAINFLVYGLVIVLINLFLLILVLYLESNIVQL